MSVPDIVNSIDFSPTPGMNPLPRTQVPVGALLLGVIAAALAGAAVLISVELAPAGLLGAGFDRRASIVLTGMLASLAGVMVSLILTGRAGHVALVAGAATFFAILAYALLNDVRF
jgi:hypothetical protein